MSQIAVGYSMRKFTKNALRAILYSVLFEKPSTYVWVGWDYIHDCAIGLVVFRAHLLLNLLVQLASKQSKIEYTHTLHIAITT